MIKPIHSEVRISGIEMEAYHDPQRMKDYINNSIVKNIAHFIVSEGSVYMKDEYAPHDDYRIFTGTLYVATKEEYIAQERGHLPEPYSAEAGRRDRKLEQEGFDRGVRAILDRIGAEGGDLQRMKLKRDQHAGDVLIETVTEIEEELING